jgi:small-conductance mechanosensitive channel
MTFLNQLSFPSIQTLGPAALTVAAILTATLLARPVRSDSVSRWLPRRRLGLPKGVARWLVIAGLSLTAMVALGIDLPGLWSTMMAGISLVAIGFVAMWSILSHMLASILIVVFRPFVVGDYVEVVGDDPITGKVTDLNPIYTTLRAADGGMLQVPNNIFFQKALKRHAPAALANSGHSLNQTQFHEGK